MWSDLATEEYLLHSATKDLGWFKSSCWSTSLLNLHEFHTYHSQSIQLFRRLCPNLNSMLLPGVSNYSIHLVSRPAWPPSVRDSSSSCLLFPPALLFCALHANLALSISLHRPASHHHPRLSSFRIDAFHHGISLQSSPNPSTLTPLPA